MAEDITPKELLISIDQPHTPITPETLNNIPVPKPKKKYAHPKGKSGKVVTGEGKTGRTRGKMGRLLAVYFRWYITAHDQRPIDEIDLAAFCTKYKISGTMVARWRRRPEWGVMLKEYQDKMVGTHTQEVIRNLKHLATDPTHKAAPSVKLYLDYVAKITPASAETEAQANSELANALANALEGIVSERKQPKEVEE